jgi:hypothetical protein
MTQRQEFALKIRKSLPELAGVFGDGGKSNTNRGEQIGKWLIASIEEELPIHVNRPAKSGDTAAPFIIDVRLAGTDSLKVQAPSLGRDLSVPPTEEEAAGLRDYITQLSKADDMAQATEWWDKLDSSRLLAEDDEYQALHLWEEEDERSLARRAYRKRIVRSLLAKGHTPTRTNAFLLDMARIVEDAVAPAHETWRVTMEEALKRAPPPCKRDA